MNNYQYYDPKKPWLVLFRDEFCCHIIDRFVYKEDAQRCYRGLQIFVKPKPDYLKILNIQDEATW